MQSADIIIIGAGPGGYELAAEQARAGRNVVIFERDLLGGTCLNRGCIPTKCLCATAETASRVNDAARFGINISQAPTVHYPTAVARMRQVTDTLRQGIASLLSNVTVVNEEAALTANRTVVTPSGLEFSAPQIIIATGSKPAVLPIPGAELALSSDDVLALEELPASVCIIGAGVIGMEFASIMAALGTQVTVVEYCPEILPPFDTEVAKRLRSMLSRRGVKIIVGAGVTAIKPGFSVEYTDKRGAASIDCDAVIMAVGRRPVLPAGLQDAGVELTPRGFIKVDEKMRTSAPGIYAVGDVNGLCMLAHAASAQARVAVGADVCLDVIPSAVFTHPECAMVGATEQALKAAGTEYKASKAMFAANGKALAMGEGEGFAKVLFSPSSRLILGCHIIGPHAADLVAEAAAAMAQGITVDDIASRIVHGHPTLSEVLMSACTI